ncbi:FIST C-terminal domain-containing protein [Ferrovibrio sp. MS7]|jgi:small ligand-binding sensory domain FIST|uniref:FIST signal transduction protein n=1 Tax=Ferrovibrio plantarum TaxID=3119164 RepID=UPI001B45E3C3|nr:FIST C-terminal domain-containing protein [Ferrovibrio sp.]
MTEQAIGSKFRLGAATAADWRMAVDGSLLQVMPVGDSANIGFVYVTEHLAAQMPQVLRRITEATGISNLLGAVSHSIAAGSREYCDEPAVACLLGTVPEGSAELFTQANRIPAGWLGIVHADPHVPALPEILQDIGEASNAYLVGGLVASREARPQWAGGLVESGLSGVVFSDAQPILTGLSQGCTQAGPQLTITAAEGNMLLELDHRPAYEALQEAFNIRSMQDLRRLGSGLMVALPIGGSDRPDYLVRNIMGIDPQAGALAIGALVEEGDQLFFCRRDVESAGRDMDRMLADLKRRCGGTEPRGAIYFSCMARSQDQFVQEPGELARIAAAFPGLPLLGMYCGGEIAAARLYGYTGVLTLFL